MNKGLTGLTRDYASKSMSKCSNDGGEKNRKQKSVINVELGVNGFGY